MRGALLMIVIGLFAATQQSASTADAERYIRESESQWAEAVANGDVSVVQRILSDDFIGVDAGDGHFYPKAEAISWIQGHHPEFLFNHLDEFKVRFFGSVAVAQGSESWERRTGEPRRGRFVWTDTWVLRNGQWQIVAAEDLVAPPLPANADQLFPLVLDQINELPVSVFNATLDSLLTLDPGKPSITPPSASGACSLDQVLPRVSAHTREFVDNVNRITAMEVRELERRHRNGRLEDSIHQKGRYVANIELLDSRHLSVEEYRDGYSSMSDFMVANGSPSLVLIFHPIHLDEFKIACAGLSTWQGTPVYLLDFQQRPDRPNTMSAFRNSRGAYDVSLKGTAWVDATTFQVVHLETDLLTRVPELLLDFEHQSLDYGPVIFAARGVSLWLPKSADISVHVGGKQFNARHHYSDYRLFVVDSGQKIAKPKGVSK